MEAYSSSYPASKSHSVRKSQAKPWKKGPVAPPAPSPIRVYKVDAINFRDLVQQLTGAPEFKPHQVQVQVQPMLSRSDIAAASSTNWYSQPEALGVKSEESGGGGKGLLELNLSSPSSSYNWCSVPQTQGTMNTFEPRRVL